jgi:peptide/nickel transport system substrate-binding protein
MPTLAAFLAAAFLAATFLAAALASCAPQGAGEGDGGAQGGQPAGASGQAGGPQGQQQAGGAASGAPSKSGGALGAGVAGTGGGAGGAGGAPSGSAAAGGAGASAEAGRAPIETLVVGISQDFDSLDPHASAATGTQEVFYNVFHGLVNVGTDGEIVPELAGQYEVSDDLLTYTFTLRDAVTFHNGKPLAAADVIYSYNRILGRTADQASPLNTTLAELVASIDSPDERTCVFTLASPSSEFIALCLAAIIPEGSGPAQKDAPCGTGPYRFVSYEPGSGCALARYDGYYGEAPYFKDVEFRIFEDQDEGLLALQAGEVHVMGLTQTLVSYDESVLTNIAAPQNMVQLMALNHAFAPFADARVRQAICHAVDKDALIEQLSPGSKRIDTNFSPVMSYFYNDGLAGFYTYDPDKARALLAEAGYGEGAPLSFTAKVPSTYQFHVDTAELIRQYLDQVGVRMAIESVSWNAWLEDVYAGRDYEATVIGLTGKVDPGAVLIRFTSGYYRNFYNYSSAAYDEAVGQANATAFQEDRARLFKDAQRLLAEDAAALFLMDPSANILMDKRLTGYRVYPIGYIDLRGVRLAEGAAGA